MKTLYALNQIKKKTRFYPKIIIRSNLSDSELIRLG